MQDDMEGCLSVFVASYPNQASVAAMNIVTGLYDEQTNGTTAMAYGDLLDLSKSRTMKLPVDWFQLQQVLGAHQRWLEILLGEAHVVPSDLLRLLGDMDHMAATDFNAMCRGACVCDPHIHMELGRPTGPQHHPSEPPLRTAGGRIPAAQVETAHATSTAPSNDQTGHNWREPPGISGRSSHGTAISSS
jgi:hypothetical protein